MVFHLKLSEWRVAMETTPHAIPLFYDFPVEFGVLMNGEDAFGALQAFADMNEVSRYHLSQTIRCRCLECW